MHHLYPSLKGDQLCPLGFHPQTRYPTRCKRCFRDYKEHNGRRSVDDVAISSPNLSDALNSRTSTLSWTSTQNLTSSSTGSPNNEIVMHFNVELKKRPQSWNSTPDVDRADDRVKKSSKLVPTSLSFEENNNNNVNVTLRLPTPPRKNTTTSFDPKEANGSETERCRVTTDTSQKIPSSSASAVIIPDDVVILSTDSLAERVRKMQLIKKKRSLKAKESSSERSKKQYDASNSTFDTDSRPSEVCSDCVNKDSNIESEHKRLSLSPDKTAAPSLSMLKANSQQLTSPLQAARKISDSLSSKTSINTSSKATVTTPTSPENLKSSSSSSLRKKELDKKKTAHDVEFMLNIKDSNYRHKADVHASNSFITETGLQDNKDEELLHEIRSLRAELEVTKARVARAEREKSDVLLRRLASMETAPNRTAASEALFLQQKVNELKEQLDKVNEEKRKLNTRMKDLEKSPKNTECELRRKLQATEQLCEELMEENQDAKKQLRNMEAEMDEMHDTFHDSQAEVNTTLHKQLENTTKNCRILSFKLKKSERKLETIEQERKKNQNEDLALKIKKLEEEVKFSNELARKLQIEADGLRNLGKKRAPMLGVLGKSTSADAKFIRESLTRCGSQEDPQQLLRDLKDSVERESDLKEQLKFAEEAADNLRKKVARFEDENDTLTMQLKKMATRSRSTYA